MAGQTYTLAVVIEGDTYYSRDVCEPGGGGVHLPRRMKEPSQEVRAEARM